jgi:hypothetical protein
VAWLWSGGDDLRERPPKHKPRKHSAVTPHPSEKQRGSEGEGGKKASRVSLVERARETQAPLSSMPVGGYL